MPLQDSPSLAVRVLHWWESLPLWLHVGLVAPTMLAALTLLHVTALNQPWGRGFGYGVFWGIIATFGIVGSTRMERARRQAQEHGEHPDGDPGRRRV